MKTETSKQRKLKYIREKNYYRLGGTVTQVAKAANEIIENKKLFKPVLKSLEQDVALRLRSKFKMKFKLVNTQIGRIGDDFIRSMRTIQLKFKVKHK